VLVWRELAGFSGCSEKTGAAMQLLSVRHVRAIKTPVAKEFTTGVKVFAVRRKPGGNSS
jgi:hypothetical protein